MSKTTYFLITLFGGWLGIHKFINKQTGMGILYILTFGLFGFGWLFDTAKAGLSLFKPSYSQAAQTNFAKTFEVAGTYFKQEDIKLLVKENPLYINPEQPVSGKRIYKYNFTRKPAILIPEPQNPHDSNAIMVTIDNIHVGYVPAEHCISIKKSIKANSFKFIEAQIYGGDYKYIDSEGDLVKEKAALTIKLELL